MYLQGKTALITGGSRGIGRAVAEKLAECGADIAIVYAGNQQAAQQTIEAIENIGVKAKGYCCDVSSFDETKQLVEQVLKDFGNVDILVNNAGVVRDSLILNMKEEDFDNVLGINLKGAFNMIKHFYQHFMRRRSGKIVNITSVIGLVGNAGQANYAAAKAGLIGLTKSTAKELAARGITCNAIAPGFIQSDMTDSLSDKTKEAVLGLIPSKRIGRASDVAELVAFLAGEHASYITGEVIRVDGGMAM